jgi:hypothetical protein
MAPFQPTRGNFDMWGNEIIPEPKKEEPKIVNYDVWGNEIKPVP